MMDWFRVYHGACSDPKWPIVARKANTNVGTVVSIWMALLDHASQCNDRGSIEGFDCETIDALYGYDDGVCERVVRALEDKKLISGGRIAAWEKRQPIREREGESAMNGKQCSSAERVRKHREKQKNVAENNHVTPCNATVTPDENHVTPCNATVTPDENHVTPCNATVTPPDKIRKEYIKPPLPPLGGGECDFCAAENSGAPATSIGSETEAPPEVEPRLVAKSGKVLAGKTLEDFERFWRDFGLSRGKAEAADAWLDIPDMTDALVARICAAAKQEAADRPRLEGRGQKPKQARGWLMSRRWEDYEMPKTRAPTRQGPADFGGEFDPARHAKAQETRKKLEAEWQARKNGGMAASGGEP